MQRAFRQLAALRAIPRHLALPDGVDPPEVLRAEGAGSLADRLAGSEDFAGLIDRLVAERLDLPLPMVQQEVMDAGTLWADEPRGCAARELAALRPELPRLNASRSCGSLQKPLPWMPSIRDGTDSWDLVKHRYADAIPRTLRVPDAVNTSTE